VDIPVLVNPVPPDDSHPDWILGKGIQPEFAKDLSVFATVQRVAGLMTPEVGSPILEALKETKNRLTAQLPEGMSLNAQGSG
jgi:hypothetical protein